MKDFLNKEIFAALGMTDTSLGWQPEKKDRIAAVRITRDQQKTDWNWNTPYWLGFGAPWGGLITSPADFARLCQLMLNHGALGEVRLMVVLVALGLADGDGHGPIEAAEELLEIGGILSGNQTAFTLQSVGMNVDFSRADFQRR